MFLKEVVMRKVWNSFKSINELDEDSLEEFFPEDEDREREKRDPLRREPKNIGLAWDKSAWDRNARPKYTPK